MTDRLSSQDAALLRAEDVQTPLHVGTILRLAPSDIDPADVVEAVVTRTGRVRRFRQRVREVPGRLADPVWADDPAFDPSWHVRRSALPSPGRSAQLEEFVARIVSRRLDRTRPLWEVHVVEGLSDGGLAIVTICHQVLVDGLNARDVTEVLLDTPGGELAGAEDEEQAKRPRDVKAVELFAGALVDVVTRPTKLLDGVRSGVDSLRQTATDVADSSVEAAKFLLRASTDGTSGSPLQVGVGTARRYRIIHGDLELLREIRAASTAAGTPVTVHDVALTILTGGLRAWLMSRGLPVMTGTSIRAMVPVSMHPTTAGELNDLDDTPTGGHLKACFVNLPVGEPDAEMRLAHIAHTMSRELRSGHGVAADLLAGLPGFAPPTLHSLGSRLSGALSRRTHSLIVTNVPGPQERRHVLGVPVTGTWPVLPLGPGHALSVGITSYAGFLEVGLLADRRGLPDLDLLVDAVPEALAELQSTFGLPVRPTTAATDALLNGRKAARRKS